MLTGVGRVFCCRCAERLHRKIMKDLRPGTLNFFWPKVLQIPRHKERKQQSSTAVYPFYEGSVAQVEKRSESLAYFWPLPFTTLGQTAKGVFWNLGTHWNYFIATILAARPAGLRSFSDDIVFLHLTMAFLADECLVTSSVFRIPAN